MKVFEGAFIGKGATRHVKKIVFGGDSLPQELANDPFVGKQGFANVIETYFNYTYEHFHSQEVKTMLTASLVISKVRAKVEQLKLENNICFGIFFYFSPFFLNLIFSGELQMLFLIPL